MKDEYWLQDTHLEVEGNAADKMPKNSQKCPNQVLLQKQNHTIIKLSQGTQRGLHTLQESRVFKPFLSHGIELERTFKGHLVQHPPVNKTSLSSFLTTDLGLWLCSRPVNSGDR